MTWALTAFGPSSRMSLPSFLACSWVIPAWKVMAILYSLPEERGSSAVSDLSESWRLTSLSRNTSRAAAARSSVEEVISFYMLGGVRREKGAPIRVPKWVLSPGEIRGAVAIEHDRVQILQGHLLTEPQAYYTHLDKEVR